MPLYLFYFASSFSVVGPTIFSNNSFKHWNPKLLLAEPDLNQLLSLDLQEIIEISPYGSDQSFAVWGFDFGSLTFAFP